MYQHNHIDTTPGADGNRTYNSNHMMAASTYAYLDRYNSGNISNIHSKSHSDSHSNSNMNMNINKRSSNNNGPGIGVHKLPTSVHNRPMDDDVYRGKIQASFTTDALQSIISPLYSASPLLPQQYLSETHHHHSHIPNPSPSPSPNPSSSGSHNPIHITIPSPYVNGNRSNFAISSNNSINDNITSTINTNNIISGNNNNNVMNSNSNGNINVMNSNSNSNCESNGSKVISYEEAEVISLRQSLVFAESGWKKAISLNRHYKGIIQQMQSQGMAQSASLSADETSSSSSTSSVVVVDEKLLEIRSLKFENEKLKRQLQFADSKHASELEEIRTNMDMLQLTTCEVLSKFQLLRAKKQALNDNYDTNVVSISDEDLYLDDNSVKSLSLRLRGLARRVLLLGDANFYQSKTNIEDAKIAKLLEKHFIDSRNAGTQTDDRLLLTDSSLIGSPHVMFSDRSTKSHYSQLYSKHSAMSTKSHGDGTYHGSSGLSSEGDNPKALVYQKSLTPASSSSSTVNHIRSDSISNIINSDNNSIDDNSSLIAESSSSSRKAYKNSNKKMTKPSRSKSRSRSRSPKGRTTSRSSSADSASSRTSTASSSMVSTTKSTGSKGGSKRGSSKGSEGVKGKESIVASASGKKAMDSQGQFAKTSSSTKKISRIPSGGDRVYSR